MSIKKRFFSEDFKTEAVELATRIGVDTAAKELNINPANIRRWKKEGTVVEQESATDLEKENRRLRKENGYLKKINEVLKKSTAIFSQDQMKNSD